MMKKIQVAASSFRLLRALFLIAFGCNVANAQSCDEGVAYFPLAPGRYWGGAGIGLIGSDLLIGSGPGGSSTCNACAISVLRRTSSSGGPFAESHRISVPNLRQFKVAGEYVFVLPRDVAGLPVTVLRRMSSGEYLFVQQIASPSSQEAFGQNIAVNEDGSVFAVGAPYAGSAPFQRSGVVHVFCRDPLSDAWVHRATLSPPGTATVDGYFGVSVSVSGNRVAIADGRSATVWCFNQIGSGWALEAAVPVGTASALGGKSVYLDGPYLWVKETTTSPSSLHNFERQGSNWVANQTLRGDYFGIIAASGGVLCTATPGSFESTSSETIELHFWRRSGPSHQWATFTSRKTAAGIGWGEIGMAPNVHLTSGGKVVVGAPMVAVGSIYNHGAALFFDLDRLDCNGSGQSDACDIANGLSMDENLNGVPDECEIRCAPDLDSDGVVDGQDLGALLGRWGPCSE